MGLPALVWMQNPPLRLAGGVEVLQLTALPFTLKVRGDVTLLH